jgi:hypothetical protein
MSGNSLFKRDASPILEGKRHLKGASAGESGGPNGADREAGTAFLPGPDDSGHGSARLKASVVNGFERLEGSEYTVHPVEPASIWLAVGVGANQDGSRVGLSAGTCDEQIGNPVDPDVKAPRPRPIDEGSASLDVLR